MMKLYRFKAVAMVFCLSLVVLAALPSAKADDWNKKTTVTFSAPVEVPGVGAQILPAGTYVFKLLDSPPTATSSRSSTKPKIMCTPPFSPSPITVCGRQARLS